MKTKNIFWGLFFILASVFVIINSLGYGKEVNVFHMVLSVLLVAWIFQSIKHLHFSGILFPIAFLCIIYSDLLGINRLTPWPVLGAALLGSIGLSIIFHDHRRYFHYENKEHFSNIIDEQDGNNIRLDNSFTSSIKYVNSQDFRLAELDCSFGALKVYFDNAVILSDNAVIQLDVSFAGVEIYVPKTWNVVNNADVSFGSIEEKNMSQSSGTPTVTLTGSASFSGISIIYV